MDLVSSIPNGSPALTERLNIISQGLISRGSDVAGAGTKALATVNNIVDRQANYLAYLDTFRLIGIFFIIALPMVVFLRVKKKSAAEIAASMKAAAESH